MRTLSLAATLALLGAPLMAACAAQHNSAKIVAANPHPKAANERPSVVPAHVQTAEYLWTPVEKATDPRTYAPYLTWAYPIPRQYGTVHAAGIKTVLYINALMPHVAGFPDYDALSGEYAETQARDCSGNPVRSYKGSGYLLDVANPAAKRAVRSIVDNFANRISPPGRSAVDVVFVDNANTMYGVTSAPCNFDASSWTSAMIQTLSAVPYPVVINTLAGHPPEIPGKVAGVRGKNIVGAMFEACFNNRYWESAEISQVQTIALLKAQRKPPGPGFWCYLNGTSADAASAIPQRLFAYASFLLTYDPQYSVFQESFSTKPSTFKVMPETQFVPLDPVTAPNDIAQLRDSSGAYVREYRYCYYKRTLLGGCKIVVNPGDAPVAVSPGGYRHSMTLSGGGILDGGQVQFTADAPSTLNGKSGAILVP